MADGRIVIDVELNEKDTRKALKDLNNTLKDFSGLGNSFKALNNATQTFGNTFNALGGIMSSTAAKGVAGIATLTVAFAKLYEASKQNFFDNLKDIGNVLTPVTQMIKGFTNEILQSFSELTGFEFNFSSMLVGAVEFESKMAQVSAIMNVTGDGINQLTDTARRFGAETRYTATEVAEAFTYMGMAGWNAQEAIAGIEDVLNLATAGATDLGLASDIVTDGLTQFGMSANQAGNFVDYMSATVTRSNTDVAMMGETLKYAGSVAGTLGISMKDLSVAIGLMAGSGVKASRAGTALRTLMANLSAPTDNTAEAMSRYGISLITAADGSVDLDATLRQLRDSLKSLPLTEQAKACKDLAGKTGMTGLMAVVNATDAEYEKLTESVANATESVSYFNENCASTGIKGEEASKKITMLREAYEGSETAAAALNLTTQDLALVVQTLGSNSDITSDNVGDLLNVFSKMKSPTEENTKAMKELGLTYHEVNDAQFDYSKTCSEVDSSILGLSQSQKEQIKSQLNTNMTMEEANKVLKEYGLYAQSASTGQIDMVANLKELRETFGDMSESARLAALEQLGLGSAIDEVNSICNMSDKEFKLYCDNLELAKGLTEKLATAMDETTKGSLLTLASAMTDVGLAAFEEFKKGIVDVSDTLITFFETWRGQDFSYTFDNFKKALDGLLTSVKNMDLAGAMNEAINGLNTFITGGGLSGILTIGGEIVSQICNGIIQNKGNIEKGISSTIDQIATWVSSHAGEIGEAGNTILNSISKGITDNKDSIRSALEAVTAVMDSWVTSSSSISALCGNFADIFIESFASQMFNKTTIKMGEIGTGFVTSLSQSIYGAIMGMGELGMNAWEGIKSWIFPEAHAGEVTETSKGIGYKIAEGTVIGVDENGNYIYEAGNTAGKQAGQGVVEGAEEGVAPLSTVMQLQEATAMLQQSATNMYNGAKVSFSKLSEVGKQSATDMYLGMQNSFNSLRTSATTSFTGLYNVINNQMLNATNSFRTSMLSMSNVASNQSANIRNGITTQFISINSVVRTQITESRNTFTTQMMSMSAVSRTQAKTTRDAITTQFISINSVVRTQITEARNAFTSQMLSMSAVARTQSNAILATFRSCASQMYSIGSQIGAGLRNGLNSQRGSIMATANSIANGVANTMRRALDIHSPSRVTTEIGKYTMQGFNNGMNRQMPTLDKDVTSNMENMANRMRTAVSMEQGKVSSNVSRNVVSTSSGTNDDGVIVGILEAIKNSIDNIDPSLSIDGKQFTSSIMPYVSVELARRRR